MSNDRTCIICGNPLDADDITICKDCKVSEYDTYFDEGVGF